MNSQRSAKFFCENCGAEVPQNAKFCKKCGRFFTSVKCPNCGFTGPSTAFSAGCPKCGYADGKNSIQGSETDLKMFEDSPVPHRKKNYQTDNSLPAWIYVLTIGILSGVVIALIKLYMS